MNDMDKWFEDNPWFLEGKWQIGFSVERDPSGCPDELSFSMVDASTRKPVDLTGVTAIHVAAKGPKDIIVRKTIGEGITLPFAADGKWSVWLDPHEVDELSGQWLFFDLEILVGEHSVKTTSDELYTGRVSLRKLPPRSKRNEVEK